MKFEQLLFEGKAGEEINQGLIDLIWDHMKLDKMRRDKVRTSKGSKTKMGLTAAVNDVFTNPRYEGHTKFELMELLWDFIKRDRIQKDKVRTSRGLKTKDGLYDAIAKLFEGDYSDSVVDEVEELEEATNRPNFSHVIVYDSGDDSVDRYTVVYKSADGGKYFYGMSDNPNSHGGVNQYLGDASDGYKEGRHLGRIIDTPEQLKTAIAGRISEVEPGQFHEDLEEDVLVSRKNKKDYNFYLVYKGIIFSGYKELNDAKIGMKDVPNKMKHNTEILDLDGVVIDLGLDPNDNKNWMSGS